MKYCWKNYDREPRGVLPSFECFQLERTLGKDGAGLDERARGERRLACHFPLSSEIPTDSMFVVGRIYVYPT